VTTTTTGFDERAMAAVPSSAPFLERIRRQAFEEYDALPIPSQETEEWRYTDLEDLGLDLRPFVEGGRAENLDQVPEEILAAAGQVGERAGLQIQRNSEVMITHLDPALRDRGVWFGDLDRAIAERPDLVEPYLHALVRTDRSKFTALHAAFRTAGTFLYVPPGVEIELPLQTMTWIDAEDSAVFPRTLLVAGENAEVTFIDRYGSPPLGRALSDAIVEIHAGQGSRVRYVALQEFGEGVTHLAVQRARVGKDAALKTLGVAFGASLARAEVEALLAEDGGSSEMLGVYFGDAEQHIDHRSNAIYTGTVIIEKGAHSCNAYQTNRNILLSEHARAQSVPNLEILSNDPTRCGHAASVGPVSDDELFYLMSRGIPEKEAQRLIVFGFFAEVLDRVDIAEIREGLEQAIENEIARGDR
jgi:Fe-S cluster assembly protein SufD